MLYLYQFGHAVTSQFLRHHGLQHTRLTCPSPSTRACTNSVHRVSDVTQLSVIHFSSCLQSFPASGSFPMSQFFISGGQSIGVSNSNVVLNFNEINQSVFCYMQVICYFYVEVIYVFFFLYLKSLSFASNSFRIELNTVPGVKGLLSFSQFIIYIVSNQ